MSITYDISSESISRDLKDKMLGSNLQGQQDCLLDRRP